MTTATKARPTTSKNGKPAATATRRPPGGGISPHWYKAPVVPAERRAVLVDIISAAAAELFPPAGWAHVQASPTDPLAEPLPTVKLKVPKRPDSPKPGTVGALAKAVKRALWKRPCRDLPEGDLTPEDLEKFFKTTKGESMELFRAGQEAEALAFHAADIPVGEFTPADWAHFVAINVRPAHIGRKSYERRLRILHRELAARGLNVGGKAVPQS